MKPRLDSLDVVVAIGMFATIIGGVILVIASYGVLGAGIPATHSPEPMTITSVMNSLQRAMDEANTKAIRLNHQFEVSMERITNMLSAVNGAIERVVQKPSIASTVQARFDQAKREHHGQIQYLTGKTIVHLTGQAVRVGMLSADTLTGPMNERIIRTARKYAALGQGRFNGQSQALMGRWIVEESQSRQRLHGHLQEQMGQAIVQKASIEHAYLTENTHLRDQYRVLTAAAVRTEMSEVLFAKLQQAENLFHGSGGMAVQGEPIQVSGLSVWNGIPLGFPLALMILLPAILIWSLTFPRASLEKTVNMTRIFELAHEISGRAPIKST